MLGDELALDHGLDLGLGLLLHVHVHSLQLLVNPLVRLRQSPGGQNER